MAASVQSIAWSNADVAIDRNWPASSSVPDDTYNASSLRSPRCLSSPSPSSSLPLLEMNYTPQYPYHRSMPSVHPSNRPFYDTTNGTYEQAIHAAAADHFFFQILAFNQDSAMDATSSWASCSTWVPASSSNAVPQWHHNVPPYSVYAEQPYSPLAQYSPSSPYVLPSLSRDSSISPQSNAQLCTPSTSEVHLEPAIADAFVEAFCAVDHHDVWLHAEQTQDQSCYHSPDLPSSTAQPPPNHFEFSPECASLLNDLMQMSTSSDAVLSGLIQTQPQFGSLPPSAFELDQSPPTTTHSLELHHPRPRRPYVPRWQCDPDFDFDQLALSIGTKSTPRDTLDVPVPELPHFAFTSSTVPEDVSSDEEDEEDDLMEEDSDVEFEDDCEWEEHCPSPPHVSYGDAYPQSTVVGPSVCLGASARGLGPQSLLFQSVPESVKSLYASNASF